MNDEDVSKRLDKIEHQLNFFAEAYRTLHNTFIQGVHVKMEKQLLDPTLSDLKSQLREFRDLYNQVNDVIKKDSILGTLAFMSKRIHEMSQSIESLNDNGIKKRIHLDFTVDGYEMVKKKTEYSKGDEKNPDEDMKNLIDSLLKDQQKTVVIHRYGLFGERPKTYGEIGIILGRTQTRARDILLKALRIFRHDSRRNLVNAINHKELKKDILGE